MSCVITRRHKINDEIRPLGTLEASSNDIAKMQDSFLLDPCAVIDSLTPRRFDAIPPSEDLVKT